MSRVDLAKCHVKNLEQINLFLISMGCQTTSDLSGRLKADREEKGANTAVKREVEAAAVGSFLTALPPGCVGAEIH